MLVDCPHRKGAAISLAITSSQIQEHKSRIMNAALLFRRGGDTAMEAGTQELL